jgi:hypothetical protein
MLKLHVWPGTNMTLSLSLWHYHCDTKFFFKNAKMPIAYVTSDKCYTITLSGCYTVTLKIPKMTKCKQRLNQVSCEVSWWPAEEIADIGKQKNSEKRFVTEPSQSKPNQVTNFALSGNHTTKQKDQKSLKILQWINIFETVTICDTAIGTLSRQVPPPFYVIDMFVPSADVRS